jgi:hypothetical protein
VLALIFLVVVTLFSVGAVALAQKLHAMGGAAPVIDARAIVDSVRDAPFAYSNLGVYLMIGTTLVPTLVHLFAVLVAIVGGFQPSDRTALIKLMRKARDDSDEVGRAASRYALFEVWPGLVVLVLLAVVAGSAALIPEFGATLAAAPAMVGKLLLYLSFGLLNLIGV